MPGNEYKYFAFISYKREDEKWAVRIQNSIEKYHLPVKIKAGNARLKNGIRPVFRDKTDLNTGILSEEISRSLRESRNLIVVCSPNSASSKWVNEEIEYFIQLGRYDRIIPVIVAGTPHSAEDECFPQYLVKYWETHPELLGIDVREFGKSKTIVHIVSRLINVSFDTLWSRHLAYQRRRRFMLSAGVLGLLMLTYVFAIPMTVEVELSDVNKSLPFDEISITTPNGSFVSRQRDTTIRYTLPGYYKIAGHSISIAGPYYTPTDTFSAARLGLRAGFKIDLKRDDTFRYFQGHVFNAEREPEAGVAVRIGRDLVHTDSTGRFCLEIPQMEQTPYKQVIVSKDGFETIRREMESPGSELVYIMNYE